MPFGPTAFLLLPWLAFTITEAGGSTKPCQGAECHAGEDESAALLQAKARKHNASQALRMNSSDGSDQTVVTETLNGALDVGQGGWGVVVRVPDFVQGDAPKPAALWRSDVYPPNQLYMLGDGGFAIPYVGYAMDPKNWNDIVLGTYYPRDANSCDKVEDGGPAPVYGRCFWTGSNWDCPGAWLDGDSCGDQTTCEFQVDPAAKGASENLCQGCHFDDVPKKDSGEFWMNQDFSVVGDNNCNCPDDSVITYTSDGVCDWVQTNLVDTGTMDNWGSEGWRGDPVTCWVNDPGAMGFFQNCYYWKYYGNNWANAKYEWWGWNEIAVSSAIDLPINWQAVMIFFPAQLAGYGLGGLDWNDQLTVEKTLLGMVNAATPSLKVGFDYIADRPGSYVVMANEMPDSDPNNPNWYHWFFCQSWSATEIKVCSKSKDADSAGNGYCYLEWKDTNCA